MKQIKNNYHKHLSFVLEEFGHFGIKANERKKVSNELASVLLENVWITEEKQEKKTKKGRRKKLIKQ